MAGILDWTLFAAKELGVWGLVLLTFLDSFISPIPPEVLFIPLSLVDPSNAFGLAAITTVISVIGAFVGYGLGLKGGRPLVKKFFSEKKLAAAESLIQTHGVMAVLVASFTPVPFKLITVLSGVLCLSIKKLIFWSTLGRGARFFIVAGIITFYGQSARGFLQSSTFSWITLSVGVIGIIVYVVRMRLRKI